ncbi:reverse transcriptase domain-containing protein [Tanacetum coccineum]
MPSHVKTYDGSGDPKDHLKLFQSAAKTERWAMPTWCHMFNSTLTGNARVWFDKLPKESINSYEDLRAAFRENYLQQTKHIKDPVEIHHIKQRDGESMEDFMERYKAEVLEVEGAPECMKISGFMHGITHLELIKPPTSWRQPEGGNKPNFKKGFKNKQRLDWKPDRFSLLTKTPKEIFALEKGKFKAPLPMVTPAEKRDPNKYCEFHADTGHNMGECMQLRKQIEEMIKSGKLSQFIRELKQNDKPKAPKKGETAGKDKPLAILMVQSWERVAKQRVTRSFSSETVISFSSLREKDGTEGPMIIEVEMEGHFVHRIYVDRGASSEVLYEHCFVRLRPEIRSQMIPATTSLIGFSGETHSGTPNSDCTKGKERANHIPSRDQGSYQRSLNDRKGRQAITSVLCKSCPTRAGDQLHPHGKIGISLAQRKQMAEKVLPGTYNCCNYGSADKAIIVKIRDQREDAKVEI